MFFYHVLAASLLGALSASGDSRNGFPQSLDRFKACEIVFNKSRELNLAALKEVPLAPHIAASKNLSIFLYSKYLETFQEKLTTISPGSNRRVHYFDGLILNNIGKPIGNYK